MFDDLVVQLHDDVDARVPLILEVEFGRLKGHLMGDDALAGNGIFRLEPGHPAPVHPSKSFQKRSPFLPWKDTRRHATCVVSK